MHLDALKHLAGIARAMVECERIVVFGSASMSPLQSAMLLLSAAGNAQQVVVCQIDVRALLSASPLQPTDHGYTAVPAG